MDVDIFSQTGRAIEVRIKEQEKNARLQQRKSDSHHKELRKRLSRESTEIEMNKMNVNREKDYYLSNTRTTTLIGENTYKMNIKYSRINSVLLKKLSE